MKKLICSILIFASSTVFAQNVKIKIPISSPTITANVVIDSKGNFKAIPKPADKPTGKTYEDEDGKLHEVWETAKGKFYILKQSPKTGKSYKYFLKY